MIRKLAVLLGVQHLQQRIGRVAAEVHAELVDFVQHEDRVDGAGAFHGLQHAARQGADVGAAMAADFGLVADAAQADAHKPATQGARDAFPQRGLAHARRPHKAQHGAFHARAGQLAHRDGFKDAFLDARQAVVPGVQHLARVGDVEVVFAGPRPGQGNHLVEPGAQDAGLGRGRRHAAQARQFLQRPFMRLRRQLRPVDHLAQLVLVLLPGVAFAQFRLNDAHLLAQPDLALAPLQFIVHAAVQVLLDFERAQLLTQQVRRHVQPFVAVAAFEHLLADGG